MQLGKILQNQKNFTAIHSLILCGGVSICLYIALAFQSQEFAQAGFIDLSLVVFLCAFISFFACYHLHVSFSHELINTKQILFFIVLFGLIFRVLGFFTFPVLEDDFYRYLWDGYVLVEQGNPYAQAPSHYFDLESVPEDFQNILDSINYPDIATVYGPMNQYFFGLAYVIAPGELWTIKLLVISADVILLFIIVLLMRVYSIKPYFLILYAWSPLVITQFSVSAHPDSKIFAFIIVPILLGFYWKRWLVFLLTAMLVSWPLGLVDAWLPEGLKAMATQWYFNAPVYALFSSLDFSLMKISLLSIFSFLYFTAWYYQWWLKENELLRGDILFGIFLLILPALNTWYLIFILPFGVFYVSRTLWAASVLIFISYIFIENEVMINSAWVIAAEFGALLLIFLWDLNSRKKY